MILCEVKKHKGCQSCRKPQSDTSTSTGTAASRENPFFPTPNGSTVSIEKPSAASSLHRQPSWDALLDQCLGGEKLSFLSFTESQFDRAIGACNSYSEWAGAQKRSREALSALQALCQPCAASKSRPREMAYVKGAQN